MVRATEVDLVLLAIGFTGPDDGGLLDALGVERDGRGPVRASGLPCRERTGYD